MSTTIIGMRAVTTGGTEDALVNIDIPEDGVITGVDWDFRANLDADSEEVNFELSFIATNQLNQNDVRGRISSIAQQISLTTSGIATGGLAKFVGPLELIVFAGERLYLHSVSTAGVVAECRCNIHLDTRRSVTRRSARR